MPRKLFVSAVCLIAFGASTRLAAEEWTMAAQESAVTMWVTKQGAWFSGVFEDFSAEIQFDAESPESGQIIGIVETRSINTEDSTNDAYVRGYLEVEDFPEARFESSSIAVTPEGYRATGELTLVGKEKPATLDFTFITAEGPSASNRSADFSGTMSVNRFDYEIGMDVDTNEAGEFVIVQVELKLITD